MSITTSSSTSSMNPLTESLTTTTSPSLTSSLPPRQASGHLFSPTVSFPIGQGSHTASRSSPQPPTSTSFRRRAIGVAGREIPCGSRPTRAFSSHEAASATTERDTTQPSLLVDRSLLRYENVPSLEDVLASKKEHELNPKSPKESVEINSDVSEESSSSPSRFMRAMQS